MNTLAYVLLALTALRGGYFPMKTLQECEGAGKIRHISIVEAKHNGHLWLRLCADGRLWSKFGWEIAQRKLTKELLTTYASTLEKEAPIVENSVMLLLDKEHRH